jgi:hypothetical protein
MVSVRVPGFDPAANGFRFANAFPHSPIRQFRLGTIANLDIGDAANGLCGGMSYTTGDIHAAGLLPPPDTSPPTAGTPVHDYIVNRQIASFDDGRVPLRFYSLMSPTRPDRESFLASLLGAVGVDRHSRTWIMIHQEWPLIRSDLDAGRLSMLGLVRALGLDPKDLGHNHQVVAYGYDLDGSALTIRICDPNWPGDTGVTISLDVSDDHGTAAPAWSKPDASLFCFFRTPYTAADPLPFRS